MGAAVSQGMLGLLGFWFSTLEGKALGDSDF